MGDILPDGGAMERRPRGQAGAGVDPRVVPRPFPVLVLALPLVGCMPDDWDGQPWTGPGGSPADTGATGPAFVGGWISEGADLSELFAADPFRYVRVEASFGADGGYAVTSTDADGAAYLLTGTFAADTTTSPATVTLLQTEPYEAEAEGIWEVQAGALTWEVVQTVPDYGFVPPTPEGGFGSTGGPGMEPGANVQTYRSAP
jgi:hypothetical protein